MISWAFGKLKGISKLSASGTLLRHYGSSLICFPFLNTPSTSSSASPSFLLLLFSLLRAPYIYFPTFHVKFIPVFCHKFLYFFREIVNLLAAKISDFKQTICNERGPSSLVPTEKQLKLGEIPCEFAEKEIYARCSDSSSSISVKMFVKIN